jgi:hypothetical protein
MPDQIQGKLTVFPRVHDIYTGAENRDPFSTAIDGTAMRRPIDATSQAAHQGPAGRSDSGAILLCDVPAITGAAPGAHNGNRRSHWEYTPRKHEIRGVRQDGKVLRIAIFASIEHGDVGGCQLGSTDSRRHTNRLPDTVSGLDSAGMDPSHRPGWSILGI